MIVEHELLACIGNLTLVMKKVSLSSKMLGGQGSLLEKGQSNVSFILDSVLVIHKVLDERR